ncbi:hypothetical protein CFP71_13465 [Amycolatopsis thailandensis]|uniref:Uncharacterized protein n=2 Tax=Amycolatopsis thailandensis TaxID=589330 RepID=A0A229SCD6_9PSEU|nr:hypothetical protein CFP71_13465 [Amycolatopsis thailandensis]
MLNSILDRHIDVSSPEVMRQVAAAHDQAVDVRWLKLDADEPRAAKTDLDMLASYLQHGEFAAASLCAARLAGQLVRIADAARISANRQDEVRQARARDAMSGKRHEGCSEDPPF